MIFAWLAVLALVLTSIQVALVVRFLRTRPSPGAAREDGVALLPAARGEGGRRPDEGSDAFISILKPVCGLDDELEENLVSFTKLRGMRYEVIISAEDEDDPALEVARHVMRAHPFAPLRIVVDAGTRDGVVNRKVERLIAAANIARGEILLISDSNVRVEPDDLARSIRAFDDPRVACVSNVFTGSGARTLGATIESLHLLGFVAPGAVLAAAAGIPCVVGKSMAIRRGALAAIGGFETYRRVLAEDQAMAVAVRKAGLGLVLSPIVVRNVIVDRTIRRAVDRQVRWNKIRYSFSHRLYAAELILNPLPFTAAAAFVMPAIVPLVLVARMLQMALLNRAAGAGLTWKQLAMTPLLDASMLYGWGVAFFSTEITWRGYRARIGRNTEMIPLSSRAA